MPLALEAEDALVAKNGKTKGKDKRKHTPVQQRLREAQQYNELFHTSTKPRGHMAR